MAKKATGEIRWKGTLATTRVRSFEGRETFELPHARSDEEARERSAVVADYAQRFRAATTVNRAQALEALKLIAGASARTLAGAVQVAGELLAAGAFDPSGTPDAPTFGKVVDEWVAGELADRFPHQVKMAGAGHLDTARARCKMDCFDPIRDVPVNLVTKALCDEVMRRLPLPPGKTEMSGSTRRQYALLITRVLNLAELAGYIDRTPIPRGWLPTAGPRKRFPILYPSEDTKLLACATVPLEWRLYYGFLHREGMRKSEAADLQFRDLDLDNGTISLDENKTDNARWWKLGPGVAAALATWRKRRKAGPDDLVFVEANGGALTAQHMADRVRGHLADAGIDRADITSTGPNKGRFGTHCFRRSFATRSLAGGKGDDWVRQRTGHTTDELLRYRQAAKGLAELELGEVAPLDEAIPELAPPPPEAGPPEPIAPGVPQSRSGREDSNLRPLDPQSSALTRLRYAPATSATPRERFRLVEGGGTLVALAVNASIVCKGSVDPARRPKPSGLRGLVAPAAVAQGTTGSSEMQSSPSLVRSMT